MKRSMTAVLLAGALPVFGRIAWAGASLDDLVGGISKDNESMGMNVEESTATRTHRRRVHERVPDPVVPGASLSGDFVLPGAPAAPEMSISPAIPARNYSELLADYHTRMTQDRDLLSRRLFDGGISRDRYDDDRNALDELAELERAEADAGNGSLTPDEVIDLTGRFQQVHEMISRDAAP